MYCFWNRFHLPDRVRLGVDAAKWALVDDGDQGISVLIRSAEDGKAIKEASTLILRGKGYEAQDEAWTEGYHWRDTLQAALALLGMGADFGDRRPGGGFTSHALERAEQRVERPVLNETPGLQVFQCDPLPLLVRAGAVKAVFTPNQERTQNALRAAASSRFRFTDAERLAFDLFSTSFFQPSPDARLLTLMMAVETLLELEPRSQEARAHVDELIRRTEAAHLPDSEKQSVTGSLRWLYDESIKSGWTPPERPVGRAEVYGHDAKEILHGVLHDEEPVSPRLCASSRAR